MESLARPLALGTRTAECADRLAGQLGERWSAATWSAAERSITGKRIKQFSVDELWALARAFNVSIPFLLTPPASDDLVAVPGAQSEPVPYAEALKLIYPRSESEDFRAALVQANPPLPTEARQPLEDS